MEYIYKIVLLGSVAVGKSSLVKRYTEGVFSAFSKSTIGVEFKTLTVDSNGDQVKLQIWDCAASTRSNELTASYYRGAVGSICVFDITRAASFEDVEDWVQRFKQYASAGAEVMIVGNKVDIAHMRSVSTVDAVDYCKQHEFPYFETSAATAENVHKAFVNLVDEIHLRHKRARSLLDASHVSAPQQGRVINLNEPAKKAVSPGSGGKSACCS